PDGVDSAPGSVDAESGWRDYRRGALRRQAAERGDPAAVRRDRNRRGGRTSFRRLGAGAGPAPECGTAHPQRRAELSVAPPRAGYARRLRGVAGVQRSLTHRMAIMRHLLVALAFVAALAVAPLSAHPGHDHKIMGTIVSIDGPNILMKTTDG